MHALRYRLDRELLNPEGELMDAALNPVLTIGGAAIGGAIGAVVGLLNAPRPGIETRTDLTERWHDVEERTAEE